MIDNGMVTAIEFVLAGSGYSTQTILKVDTPPPNLDGIPRVSELEILIDLKFPNNFYHLESSKDMILWEQFGDVFFAAENLLSIKVPVDGQKRFYKAVQHP